MKLSLIIPVYNEARHLESFLAQLDAADFGLPKELVFIDDCSTDNCAEILKAFKFQSESRLLWQAKNQGKGAAIRRGIAEATGTVIAVQDADFEYDLNDLKVLIQPVLESRSDIVYGSRFRKNGTQVHRTFHYLVNRMLTIASNFMSGLYLSDMETCYKIFRAEIIQNINLSSDRFGFEPEVTAKIARLKVRVEELPIRYFPRNYMEGKKISWRDGIAAFWHIAYFNVFSNKKKFFKPGMPSRYVVSGTQWL